MKTPKEYSDNLKKGIITDLMVSDVLFSYSKRAKNYRDKIRQYKYLLRTNWYYYDKYDNIGKYTEKKNMLYEKKNVILKKYNISPSCIHRTESNSRKRILDYYPEYEDIVKNKQHLIIHRNSFYDYDLGEEVSFVDIPDEDNRYLYFLYFEYPNHTYHNPIKKEELENYKDLEIKDIDELITYGEDINELLSLLFCDKVYDFINSQK